MFGSSVSGLVVALGMLAAVPFGAAHMEMTSPAPLGSQYNKNTPAGSADYDMKSPLLPDGSQFPCRGHLNLLDGPGGAPVATWAPGSTQQFSIAGSAYHGGGSCQAMLSYDSGKSWTVIKSWIGNCPTPSGGDWSFTVPSDAPAGEKVIFGWSWFNRQGNREMYHNCASVTISGGGKAKRQGASFSSRPAPFLANIGNGCATTEGGDTVFPNPGPDVDNTSNNPIPPAGNCGSSSGPQAPAASPSAEQPSAAPSAQQPSAPAPSAEAPSSAAPPAAGPSNSAVQPSEGQANNNVPSSSAVESAPPAASTTGGKKQCKRYRKRNHRRTHPARAHF